MVSSSRELESRLEQWRREMAAWAVALPELPELSEGITIRGSGRPGPRPPWRPALLPESRSFEREAEALPAGGTLLDVGPGPGGSCLPLAGRAGLITAVDASQHRASGLDANTRSLGTSVRILVGRWPEVADDVEAADLVICHHVLWEVADLEPFMAALTTHARRRVVVELSMRLPRWQMNPLWERFYGLRMPEGPTALDAAAVAELMGLRPQVENWVEREGFGDFESFEELVEDTRVTLHLPAERLEVAEALEQIGVDPATPRYIGTVGRRMVTIWWEGRAG